MNTKDVSVHRCEHLKIQNSYSEEIDRVVESDENRARTPAPYESVTGNCSKIRYNAASSRHLSTKQRSGAIRVY